MATFIRTGSVGVLETFGKFTGVVQPGLKLYFPFVQKIYRVNTQVNQIGLQFKVRTKDNTFSRIDMAVQYHVRTQVEEGQSPEEGVRKSFYSLRNPQAQMTSYVEDIVRSRVPKMDLKTLFEDKEGLQNEVKAHLAPKLEKHGYILVDTLVTNIEPAQEVQDAMNKVQASARLLEVAVNEANANRVKLVQEAEADKERKKLQGEGIAAQREAILNGYHRGVKSISEGLGVNPHLAIQLTLYAQYYDTLKEMASKSGTKTIFMPTSQEEPQHSFERFQKVLLGAQEAQTVQQSTTERKD